MFRNVLTRIEETLNTWQRAYFADGGIHITHTRILAASGVLVVLVGIIFYTLVFSAPHDFPEGRLVVVERGTTITQTAYQLEDAGVIRSPLFFILAVRILAPDSGVIAGDYFFLHTHSLLNTVQKLTRGEYGLDPIRITFPEGATSFEMAELLDQKFPSFDVVRFLALADGMEGYLFPDTYFFLPNVRPEQVVRAMFENFEDKVRLIEDDLNLSDHTLNEVVIMASILEKEALTREDKEIIAGILWKRLEISMPLQVDAPFVYAIGKGSFDLTMDDLREDGPYNTYVNRGLPLGPIANPGLDALEAALNPEESPYLFYLSDKSGRMHYARDFEEHKANKRLYLN